ncbi:hypothetical protein RJ640_005266 [Escallonia rubra]|uniref:Ubiquitin-conjugating enzyme E2 H n=1 Tax=Escallonia rubra TaxID=112253 RepID=A0AA88S1G3_9ASTE|nr:hypothetical protein RJ640_005266 [Escallonia rubra]
MSSPSKRREMDVMKLMMSDYNVEMLNDGLGEFNVELHGPEGRGEGVDPHGVKDGEEMRISKVSSTSEGKGLYEGGVWKVHVELPDSYPYKSPSIGFVNKILHPNIDELSGGVCLDVINESWSPMFDLVNIFEVFLPQLLLYPNPSHPLNVDAASLMTTDKNQYKQRVKAYCDRYAKKENTTTAAVEEESGTDISDGECTE